MWPYYSGVLALGGAVGFFVAMSRSPVVATLLPLLFGLLGGAGTFYAMKADLNELAERSKLRTLGLSLSAFVVGLVSLASIAAAVRERVPGLPLTSVMARSPASINHAVQLAQLRRELLELGASKAEVQQILNAAPAPLAVGADDPDRMATKAKAIGQAASALIKIANETKVDSEGLRERLDNLKSALEFAVPSLSVSAERVKNKDASAAQVLKLQVEYLTQAIHSLAGGSGSDIVYTSDKEILAKHPDLLNGLLAMRAGLQVNAIRFDAEVRPVEFFKPSTERKQREAGPPALGGLFADHRPALPLDLFRPGT